ncbi:MAG: hypothetical protein ACRDWW_06935, partial [Acidimicrobiales bacterium]
PLVRLEAVDDMEARGSGGPDTGRVDFTALESGPRAPGAQADLRDARAMVLGFDYSALDPGRLARSLQSGDRGVPADPDLLHAELGILKVFADLCMLSRNRRVDEVGGEEAHNPREYFLAYLRGLDLGQAGCPPSFVEKLSRALSHYGVDGSDRTDRLEEAVHLIYKAQQRVANQVPFVTALLERYLQHPAGAPVPHAGEVIDTLDRLIVATQLRHPAVGGVARSARYQLFDRPLIDAGREDVFKSMRAALAALAAGPGPAEHERLLHEMVTCPQPLIRLMSELGGGDGDAEARRRLVEVQTRRYYQAGRLGRVGSATVGGRHVVAADLGDGAGAARVVAAAATSADLDSPGPLGEAILQAASDRKVLVDVYLRWTDAQPDPTTLADRVGKAAAGLGLDRRVERLTISVSGVPQGAVRADGHRFFNYRWDEANLVEQTTLRDLHPMIAERLQIWRLDRFELTRLASPPDVYLFLCTGKDAPGDRRLVALAEIRDLTPLTDDTGTVVALPALEQVLSSCVDGLRRARARMGGRDQPRSHRLLLFAWPTSEVPVRELASVVRRIAPLTEGLDVEQILVQGRAPTSRGGEARELAVKVTHPPGSPLTISVDEPDSEPLQTLDRYSQKVQQAA